MGRAEFALPTGLVIEARAVSVVGDVCRDTMCLAAGIADRGDDWLDRFQTATVNDDRRILAS